jgi:hypothetical protein
LVADSKLKVQFSNARVAREGRQCGKVGASRPLFRQRFRQRATRHGGAEASASDQNNLSQSARRSADYCRARPRLERIMLSDQANITQAITQVMG